MNKKPSAKPATEAAVKKPVAKAVKPVAKKAAVKKPVARATLQKIAIKKPAAKVASRKAPARVAASKKDDGGSLESLIAQRDIDLKSVDEALGIKYDNTKDHKPIPGKFDMIIPPGTPRKLIINMAKEFNIEVAQRNDYYVPIGICDCQRELLVFRGDQKSIEKASKEFFKRLKAWAK
jgi:hypothetical protein